MLLLLSNTSKMHRRPTGEAGAVGHHHLSNFVTTIAGMMASPMTRNAIKIGSDGHFLNLIGSLLVRSKCIGASFLGKNR